ncbi:PASTA domain-containing protein [Flavobacterium aquatile]|uniref:Membrane protein n=1 Tax=Flavobacterium aquatile LMG 4008 = ATCC 11947 TaxID=1453498 RepID=A0A095SSU6_9FLAO|nr:PASTA domain-containing protein [Flavobacterium aquatile]KGD67617.1 membrane protein [Flavobacterium aquatile LMG 4008 = ATCC 11947]OXA67486.1 PASTA domain-containing protein [Flavobacterium aquatile LMG 4008 = ATCC 11947]GEC79181.1 PASTA domain-containing protein [Flavobacterium aquatile]
MSFKKYITSRVFLAQLLAALAIMAVLAYLFFHWITFITNHGDEITVPNLSKLNPEQVEEKLDELDLDYQIIDTVDYRSDFPKLTVVEQEPTSGSKVKGGRTIYIKLNASTFKMVSVPDLIEKTYRQAVPTLKAVGLQEGSIKYVPYLGKDMVLEMWINGKKIKAGEKVLKNTKVDLVLGDGKVVFDESQLDTVPNTEIQIDSISNEQ